jgi:hypothetical protein
MRVTLACMLHSYKDNVNFILSPISIPFHIISKQDVYPKSYDKLITYLYIY